MVCPKCRESAPDGLVFCPSCGVSLAEAATAPPDRSQCPGCHREITPGTSFCPFCGTLHQTDSEAKVTDFAGKLRIITFPMDLTVQALCKGLPGMLGFPVIGDDGSVIKYQLFVEGRSEPLEEALTLASCQSTPPADLVLHLTATRRPNG